MNQHPRTPFPVPSTIASGRLAALVLAVLVLPVAGPLTGGVASAQDSGTSSDPGEDRPLFTSTHTLARLEGDPWKGGAWIGMGTGLIFKPLESGTSQAEGPIQFTGLRDGLPGLPVHSLAVTSDRVYVGTGGGLVVLEKATNQFTNVTLEDGSRLRDPVYAVGLEDDRVWVGTAEKGMFRVDPDTLVAHPVGNPHSPVEARFDNAVMDFAFDGDEMFISVNRYGVVEWDRASGETERYQQTGRVDEPLYFRMALTSERIWVGTSYDGAISYNRETGEAKGYSGGDTLQGLNVYDVEYIGENLWFTTDSGIARYDRAEDEWYNYQNAESGWAWGPARAMEMVDGTVYAMARHNVVASYTATEDTWERVHWWSQEHVAPWDTMLGCIQYEDKLLFTTGGAGTWLYDPGQGTWADVKDALGEPGKEPPEILHRDADADQRALWVATDNGLGRFDRGNQSWSTHETYADHVHEKAWNKVNDVDLTEDSVWAAAMGSQVGRVSMWASGHLARMDRDTGEWTRWNTSDGLSGENVTAAHPLQDRTFTGVNYGGIDAVNPETDEVTHVYPEDDGEVNVTDFATHDGFLWSATTDGLVRINTTTLDTHRPEPLRDIPIHSLMWRNDTLWMGGVGNGLHRWDPATNTLESFTVEQGPDIWGYCMFDHQDTLYIGTQRGVERFDPQEGEFLPKYGTLAQLSEAGDRASAPEIDLQEPEPNRTVVRGSSLEVAGTSQGASSATVQVRVGSTAWQSATGLEEWSSTISLDGVSTGPATVTARLIRNGDVLAQDAREIQVTQASRDDQASPGNESRVDPTIRHDPVLETTRGDSPLVEVGLDPRPTNVNVTLLVQHPDRSRTEHHVPVADNGTAWTRLPAFDGSGMAGYAVEIAWDGGNARLPRAHSSYGTFYPLAVKAVEGIASARLDSADRVAVAPGDTATVSVSLQNTGTRTDVFALSYAGEAASWLEDAPSTVAVDGGSSRTIELRLSPPTGTSEAEHELSINATPEGVGPGQADDLSISVAIDPSASDEAVTTEGEDGSNPTPSLALPGIVLATVSAAVVLNRRSGKD